MSQAQYLDLWFIPLGAGTFEVYFELRFKFIINTLTYFNIIVSSSTMPRKFTWRRASNGRVD